MSHPTSRLAHLGVAVVVLTVDYVLSSPELRMSYSVRAVAALALWVAALRLAPLAGPDSFPRWGNWKSSLRWLAIVAGGIGLLGVTVAVVSRFGLEKGFFLGEQPPFVVENRSQLLPYLIFGGVAAPIVEEFIYRGVIQPRLRVGLGPMWAVALAGPLFWALHWVYHGGVTPVSHLFAGWVLAFVYEKTRSLLGPTLLHSAGNLSLLGLDALYFRLPELFAGV
jgi:membrane protease YdiL (CAAX protease family)